LFAKAFEAGASLGEIKRNRKEGRRKNRLWCFFLDFLKYFFFFFCIGTANEQTTEQTNKQTN